jgi:hypothetical protein
MSAQYIEWTQKILRGITKHSKGTQNIEWPQKYLSGDSTIQTCQKEF